MYLALSVHKNAADGGDAEADGLTSLWYASVVTGDPLVAMAVAGRETSRIELGTAVRVRWGLTQSDGGCSSAPSARMNSTPVSVNKRCATCEGFRSTSEPPSLVREPRA